MPAGSASKPSIRTLPYRLRCPSPPISFLAASSRHSGPLGQVFRLLNRREMQKQARSASQPTSACSPFRISASPVETLSGGQRQGVAVARAAAFGSRVVIMDEPTAALGVKELRKVLELILNPEKTPAAHRADFPQHAACIRGCRPHPHQSAGPPSLRGRSEGHDNVGCRGANDRRQEAAAGNGSLIIAPRRSHRPKAPREAPRNPLPRESSCKPRQIAHRRHRPASAAPPSRICRWFRI